MDIPEMTHAEALIVLTDALILARERVTGDTIAAKQEKRDQFKSAVHRIYLAEDGDEPERPSAQELRELLGNPGGGDVHRALEAWDDSPEG